MQHENCTFCSMGYKIRGEEMNKNNKKKRIMQKKAEKKWEKKSHLKKKNDRVRTQWMLRRVQRAGGWTGPDHSIHVYLLCGVVYIFCALAVAMPDASALPCYCESALYIQLGEKTELVSSPFRFATIEQQSLRIHFVGIFGRKEKQRGVKGQYQRCQIAEEECDQFLIYYNFNQFIIQFLRSLKGKYHIL